VLSAAIMRFPRHPTRLQGAVESGIFLEGGIRGGVDGSALRDNDHKGFVEPQSGEEGWESGGRSGEGGGRYGRTGLVWEKRWFRGAACEGRGSGY